MEGKGRKPNLEPGLAAISLQVDRVGERESTVTRAVPNASPVTCPISAAERALCGPRLRVLHQGCWQQSVPPSLSNEQPWETVKKSPDSFHRCFQCF